MFEAINTFRRRLKAGETLVGAGVSLSDPLVSDALAGSGVDFLWIDQEHSPQGPEALAAHLLAARGRSMPVLVRVAGGGAPFIKPVLDAGVEAIVLPQVRSAEEVREAVADCRYPPAGRRGYGPRVPTDFGRHSIDEYLAAANAGVFVAAMIETTEALAALDEITAIEGLDAVVVGPWDLSGSMNMLGDVENPRVVAAMESIIATARARELFVGAGMGASAAFGRSMAKRGVQFMQVGADFEYMLQRVKALVESIKSREPHVSEESHASFDKRTGTAAASS